MARIALYYPWVYLRGGGERLIRELVGASRHEWTILTNRFDTEGTFPEMQDLDVVELDRVSIERSLLPLVHAALTIRMQRLPVSEYDALVVVCEGFGDLVTFRAQGTPTMCVCFTPLKIIHDDAAAARMRATKGPTTRMAYTVLAPFYRAVERAAWRRYYSVVAISEEVKRRIVSAGLAEAEKVTVAYPGVVRPGSGGLGYDDYFLIAGRVMWEKNLELGIDAFRVFRDTPGREGFSLKIAGHVDDKSVPYLKSLQERASGLPVEFVQTPPTGQMLDLYARCLGLLFTAPNEEFGIVVLEAMAHRKPVIAVERGGPSEIIRDGVDGLLVEPDAASMALAMERLASARSEAVLMGERGHARALSFTWERFAEHVDSKIDEAIAAGGRSDPRRTPDE